MGIVRKTAGQEVIGGIIGDITADAGSIGTAELADGAVTLAKQANIATDSLIGRDTASTGVPEAITLGVGNEFSGSGTIINSAFTGDVTKSAGSVATTVTDLTITSEARGDLLRRGASAWERLDANDSGKIVIGDGTDVTSQAVTGDVTISGSAVTAIGADKVLSAMVEPTLAKRTAVVTIADAAIKTLNSAPTTLIAAPSAGSYHVVDSVVCLNTFNTAAYEAGSDTLKITYTNAAGAEAATAFTNAFLESGSTAIAVTRGIACVPVSGAAVVASCASDPSGGNAASTLKFIVNYHTVTLP